MRQKSLRHVAKSFLNAAQLTTITLACLMTLSVKNRAQIAQQSEATPGSLQAVSGKGESRGLCPLRHTTVKAEISGYLSRVTVKQEFLNPFPEKIEAIYTFPLPENSAVDSMTMQIGERLIKGEIKRREEAESVYQSAKANGQAAALLDQQRPNIFTQRVANILPQENVTISISYVETLKYEDGSYEFSFPMVVGERYIPGGSSEEGQDDGPGTNQVPDAARLNPARMPEGMRAGHDISIEVALDAGVPLDGLASSTHEILTERPDERRAIVRLKDLETIPNKDFVLKYDVAGRRIEDALLAHRTGAQGFFTLILQPPERVKVEDVTPKELVFVLDTSGSMQGFPLDKAKETVKLALDGLYPQDTFNLITFSGDTNVLFDYPVPATPENVRRAKKFLESRKSNGGTEMMKAIKAALAPSDQQDHLRIACFMTDGQVGDDMEILAEVQKHTRARVFSIGFGDSPNRFLLDKMAAYGRGEVEYVAENDKEQLVAQRFFERVRDPLLTDISIEWADLAVTDIYPKTIPDLFGAKPVILSGRYTRGGSGVIRLKGRMSGRDFVREIPVQLPDAEARHDVLASLWARQRIDDLMGQDMSGAQTGKMREDLRETITQLGLDYRLMTQFTSFVAVEDRIVTHGGEPRPVAVPAEAPPGAGMSGVMATVDVTATSTSMVNPTTASVSSTITSQAIMDLPLNGRNMLSLAYVVPGVAAASNRLPESSPAGFSVNGQRPRSNAFVIDGVDANVGISAPQSPGAPASVAGTQPALTIAGGTNGLAAMEATQEFSVTTHSIEAQTGRVSGGQISIITRSGTNEFHGSLFEYFANDRLDANDWFANSRALLRPAHRQNIFGGTFGGPLEKDKNFFFLSYEGARLGQPVVGVTDVPSLETRASAPVAIQPFLNAFPLPTSAARTDGMAESASSFTNGAGHNAASVRLDSNLNNNLTLFGRYNFSSSDATERGGGLFSLNTVSRLRNRTQTLTAGATYTISPTIVTDLRFNFSRARTASDYHLDEFGGAIPVATQMFSSTTASDSFIFDLDGRNAAWKTAGDASGTQRQLNAVGSLTVVASTHTLKFGADWRRLSPTLDSYTQEQNVLFDAPQNLASGSATRANLFTRDRSARPVFQYLSLYSQDEWKIRPRFSLTYGVRWELAPAPSDRSAVDGVALAEIEDATNLQFAPAGSRLWRTTFDNFAPRAGFVYELIRASNRQTVLRGGFGLLYDTANEEAAEVFTNSYPQLAGQSFFNVPFPLTQPGTSLTPRAGVPALVFDPQLKLPYTLEWNVSLERALGSNQKISLAYVGAAARRLLLAETLVEPGADFTLVRFINNGGRSNYRSLQLQFDRRFSNHLQALLSYTLARSKDDVPQDALERAVLSSRDRRLDSAHSDFDVRHQLAGNLIYEIPALFDSGFGNSLTRKWLLNAFFYARTARPLSVLYSLPTSVGFAYLRPDLLAGVPLYLEDDDAPGGRRINSAAFAVPDLQRQGTLGRNALRGFPFYQLDLGFGRNFNLREGVRLQLRVDAFNFLNHANFEDPLGNDLSLGSKPWGGSAFRPNGTFGRSASMAGRSLWAGAGRSFQSGPGTGGPRSVQFSVKLQF